MNVTKIVVSTDIFLSDYDRLNSKLDWYDNWVPRKHNSTNLYIISCMKLYEIEIALYWGSRIW